MRSPREITFRLRQEIANAVLSMSSPNPKLRAESLLAILPDPDAVASGLRGTEYSRNLISIADEILRGRIPILGCVIDYGPEIAWRKDPYRGTETPAKCFRKIPYLDLAGAGDHKFIWEVNRHQHLVLMSQAAVLTANNTYSDYVLHQLEHWWAENPFQHGINWTSALEVAFRALSWIWIFHLIGSRMAEEFRQKFLAELHRHGLHLEYNLSLYFSPNTHLLGEAVALQAIGRLFPQFPRAEKWRSIGHNIVRKHMDACVRSDGSYFEQSTYYHMYALDMFAFHAVLEDVGPVYLEKLARMAEFLAAIVSETGELPFLGDDDGGRLFHPYGPRPRFARASLAMASILTEKRFFPFEDRDIHEVALWWLGPVRYSEPLLPAPQSESRVFRDTGVIVIRQNTSLAVFDAGPFGPGSAGHSHSDTLSFVVTAGDHEVLIDSGTFSYMDPEWRSNFRGSAAHNTVRIDSRDQAVPTGPFRWSDKPQVHLVEDVTDQEAHRLLATCTYGSFTHQRSVKFSQCELLVLDSIAGPAGQHHVEQFWHFALEPRETSPGTWAIGEVAEFAAEGGIVEPSWRSRCFGTKEPAWTIVVRKRATLPFILEARLRIRSR